MSILTGFNIIVIALVVFNVIVTCIRAAHGISRNEYFSVNLTPTLALIVITVIINVALTYYKVV